MEVIKSELFSSSVKNKLSLNSSVSAMESPLTTPASARGVETTPNSAQKIRRNMIRAKAQRTPREMRKELRAINRRFTPIFADWGTAKRQAHSAKPKAKAEEMTRPVE